jgi:hypothetical protein
MQNDITKTQNDLLKYSQSIYEITNCDKLEKIADILSVVNDIYIQAYKEGLNKSLEFVKESFENKKSN